MSNSKIVKYKDKRGNSYPYLYIDELTGIFYAVKGNNKRSLGKEFQKARNAVLSAISEMQNQVVEESGTKIVKDFYEIMIEEKIAISTKPKTLKRIETIWRLSIEPYWGFMTAADISQDKIVDFMTWHRRKRPGVQFINTFKYLGNIFNLMVERGAMPLSQKPKLVIPKDEQKHHDKQKGRYITDEEVKKIIQHSDERTELLVSLAFCTGMRKMEICALEAAQIELVKKTYVVKLDTDDTKTGLARVVPIPGALNDKIKLALNNGGKYLFPMVSNKQRHISGQLADKGWNDAKEKSNILGKMRFHDLRHTCASNMAKDGINPVIAVTMLGMSLVTFQKTYLKLTASDLIIASESNAKRIGFQR